MATETLAGEPLILSLLARKGILSREAMATARTAIAAGKKGPEVALIEAGLASETEIASSYAEAMAVQYLEAVPETLAQEALNLGAILPRKFCTDNHVAPLSVRGGTLDVLMINPEQFDLFEEIEFLTSFTVNAVIGPISVVERHIDAVFNGKNTNEIAVEFHESQETQGSDNSESEEILNLDKPPPMDDNGRIVLMVNQIFEQALRSGASDIHLESFERRCRFRLRIDGMLHEMPTPSRAAFLMITSRLKILAKMDIAEKRVPQDGAISLQTGDRRIDLRVNTVPTVYGEKIVMRILDKEAISLDLTNLGLDERQVTDLTESIHMPHGLALITGPTGSGKSTTLYSCLNLLNEPKINICTVEDPVEYRFDGMNQVQVKNVVGLTFASALRAFLRQDPDVIMVGEVRDRDTAEICLRAALTGHFVLSTIHTNDALAAVTRLQDMGVEPFLLSCSLRVLEAQRLLRRLCPLCKEGYEVNDELATRYNLVPGSTIYRPVGCQKCRRMGYKGRVGVFEVVRITPRLSRMIQENASLPALRQAAREEGMKLLIDSALDKVRSGLTSLEAALSVTMSDD
ncbi:MAG: GspE/PulE family protein [Isosphaeraceae bacterium]